MSLRHILIFYKHCVTVKSVNANKHLLWHAQIKIGGGYKL